ncbi:MAG: hypothetical protein WBE86_07995 [Candidatus Acidiferrales bacterium]
MARPCHVAGCSAEILPVLAGDGVCLNHFVEMVVERADQVRVRCVESQPVDEKTIDWLLGNARHAAQALSASQLGSCNEQVLELLLCLANLQDYIAHHSVRVKAPH